LKPWKLIGESARESVVRHRADHGRRRPDEHEYDAQDQKPSAHFDAI